MSEYKDLKNNAHEIRQMCVIEESEKEKIEDEIVEELYKIFTK